MGPETSRDDVWTSELGPSHPHHFGPGRDVDVRDAKSSEQFPLLSLRLKTTMKKVHVCFCAHQIFLQKTNGSTYGSSYGTMDPKTAAPRIHPCHPEYPPTRPGDRSSHSPTGTARKNGGLKPVEKFFESQIMSYHLSWRMVKKLCYQECQWVLGVDSTATWSFWLKKKPRPRKT